MLTAPESGMNITKTPLVVGSSDEAFVDDLVSKMMRNGGKSSIHIVHLVNQNQVELLRQKGWYEPPLLVNKKDPLIKRLVSTDIKHFSSKWLSNNIM